MTSRNMTRAEFDVIVVGSGTCGSTIARQLARSGQRVLVLERGSNVELSESFIGIARIAGATKVSDNLATMKATTAGGTTALYFGVAEPPPLDVYKALGIDLTEPLREAYDELPIAELPDSLLSPQSVLLRDSAVELGHSWQKKPMLVDASKCQEGYSYQARWKARSFLEDAVGAGAQLTVRATVNRVLVDQGTAIGVEYQTRSGLTSSGVEKAFAPRVVLAAGSLSTPMILRRSGVASAGKDGFYCCPNFAVLGFVPGLKGRDGFVGCMNGRLDENIAIGDANLTGTFFRMVMLAELKLSKFFSYSTSIAVGGSVRDELGGGVQEDGRYYKKLTEREKADLKRGEAAGVRILEHAGAKGIMRFNYASANVGGLVRIGEHLDDDLQTEIRGLHVCDGSVLPGNLTLSPVLTLVCLSKYLSRRMLNAA
jgi:hypothetical protein